ncbi:hypothetical protein PRUPE_5G242300 [Prunus persica]|uniref:NAB domain-containing protein n=1 Tax=Prunus persica TaxID=3760 RepID=M5WB27_PRUPE|nr:hypothetical protein PRUPE_5G242300 [Prunus persica]ONI09519.1 hypothetical protein PRUPE_5G242300 [Prunus persica]
MSDVEEKMKMLGCSRATAQQEIGDTFAERAEAYYKRRPQLLSLLRDLYNSYLTLSDRYIQTVAKTQHHRPPSSQISVIDNDYYDYDDQEEEEDDAYTSHIDSDVESSLSYQQLPPTLLLAASVATQHDETMLFDLDSIVTEIVVKNVEYDILLDEANMTERRYKDASRKIELQKSLLEVLESERLILLNENAKLGYKVGALVEENKALASESLFIRRKAGELARCLLKTREDQRVCMLSRKIEDLQGQIYGLEKRNKDYYEQLVKRDQRSFQLVQEEEESCNINKSKINGNQVNLEVCFQIRKINRRLIKRGNSNGSGKEIGVGKEKKGSSSSLWERVKNMDLFLCGGNQNST